MDKITPQEVFLRTDKRYPIGRRLEGSTICVERHKNMVVMDLQKFHIALADAYAAGKRNEPNYVKNIFK